MSEMQCVILAGGLGTRMRPLTQTLPKFLLPVHDRPFADYQLRWLASQGVTQVVLCIGYQSARIREYVGEGSRWGLEVFYVDEADRLRGTAGALRLAFDHGVLDDSFFVLYGDSFLPVDFPEIWLGFRASGSPAQMTVYHNRDCWDTSNTVYDNGRVILYDKVGRDSSAERKTFIDYGLSAFHRSVIASAVPPDRKVDLAEVLHDLSVTGQLAGFEVYERFYEVGSPEGLRDFAFYAAEHLRCDQPLSSSQRGVCQNATSAHKDL